MRLVFTLSALALIAFLVFDFVRAYLKATTTGWQRVWDAGRGSATIIVVQLGVVASGIATASGDLVDWICSLVNDPSAADPIKTAIAQYCTPTTVGVAMVGYLGLVAWARLRTLNKV
jgi:ABC-type sulfate transport system permease component